MRFCFDFAVSFSLGNADFGVNSKNSRFRRVICDVYAGSESHLPLILRSSRELGVYPSRSCLSAAAPAFPRPLRLVPLVGRCGCGPYVVPFFSGGVGPPADAAFAAAVTSLLLFVMHHLCIRLL